MKNINSLGLFDEHFLLEKLTKLGQHIDWNIFVPILDVVLNQPKNSNNVSRPLFDRLMMFKILILQSLYNLPRQIGVRWNIRLPIVVASCDFSV